jgi:hypothetical protein
MITIDFSDIDPDKIVAKCEEQIADYLEDKMTDVYTDLTAPPPKGTPVDQGTARNGWQLDTSVKLAPEVYNPIAYIGRLNNGHSKQSPAGFIDTIVDAHFRD